MIEKRNFFFENLEILYQAQSKIIDLSVKTEHIFCEYEKNSIEKFTSKVFEF